MPKITDILLWPLDRLFYVLSSRAYAKFERAEVARAAALAAGASEAEAEAAAKRTLFGLSAD
jgi:hypothetical protein